MEWKGTIQFMKEKIAKIILMVGIMSVFLLSGCVEEMPISEEGKETVYEFGKEKISYGEVYIYANTIKENYESTYGPGIWSIELENSEGILKTVESVTREDIIESINRAKVLASKANKYNISLSEENKAEIKEKAKAFYEGLTKQDLETSRITLPLVEKIYEENTMASKVYKKVLMEQDFEVSEEEARMTTFFDMIFECYTLEEDGTITPYSDEKKTEQFKKANEALHRLATEENMDERDIVIQYDLQYTNTYTLSKIDIIKEYGEEVSDVLLGLSDGGFSKVVESEYGYHIFKMIQIHNVDFTKENQANMTAEKEKEYFAVLYEKWLKEYDGRFNYQRDVNMEVFEEIPLSKK